jgi:hypothetical protein
MGDPRLGIDRIQLSHKFERVAQECVNVSAHFHGLPETYRFPVQPRKYRASCVAFDQRTDHKRQFIDHAGSFKRTADDPAAFQQKIFDAKQCIQLL